jgi:hypothetical protein
VIDISESRKTEELAGFIEIADKSAPNAPNAPPIELNLEVPS